MLHTILPSYNNVVGWTQAQFGKCCWSFYSGLLNIEAIDPTNKNKDITAYSTDILFRCSLKLRKRPDAFDKNQFYRQQLSLPMHCNHTYYKIIGCYKSPEEAFDAAIKELEWTELQFLSGVPSDYYAPYQ